MKNNYLKMSKYLFVLLIVAIFPASAIKYNQLTGLKQAKAFTGQKACQVYNGFFTDTNDFHNRADGLNKNWHNGCVNTQVIANSADYQGDKIIWRCQGVEQTCSANLSQNSPYHPNQAESIQEQAKDVEKQTKCQTF
ncbi:MAG: hypothetical protein GF332_00925, partial [Candidatus Moranbacteria bacterium]|nr:hypothetical protein [Candidatus Moranbacteria bacterium]